MSEPQNAYWAGFIDEELAMEWQGANRKIKEVLGE